MIIYNNISRLVHDSNDPLRPSLRHPCPKSGVATLSPQDWRPWLAMGKKPFPWGKNYQGEDWEEWRCLKKRMVKTLIWSVTLYCAEIRSMRKDRNRNRKLKTSKAPLKSQAQGTSLFTSAASNQRGFPNNSPWESQVRLPEGERMRQIRGVFQRIVRGELRSGCQKVRGGRLGVKAGVV